MRSSKSPAVTVRVRGRCPVTLRQPRLGALVRFGADHRGELSLDQGLVDRLGRLPDRVADLGSPKLVQHLQQGRLIQVIACNCVLCVFLVVHTETHAMTRCYVGGTPDKVTSYTTRRDATSSEAGVRAQFVAFCDCRSGAGGVGFEILVS
jgi:hypothetical protein